MTATQSRRRGVAYALASAVLFGASAPLAKLLLRDVAPQLVAGLLYLGSGGGLALTVLLKRGPREARLRARDIPWLAAAILFGGLIAPLSLMNGLVRTDAATGSLLLNMEGVFTATIAWIVFRENVDRRVATGMLAIVAGGVALSWSGAPSWRGASGALLIASACLFWAIDNNVTQKISGGDPVQIAMLKGLCAGAMNTALALQSTTQLPKTAAIAGALLLGFASYGVSLVLFVYALRFLGTARTGAYFSVAPFIGGVLAVLVFHERPTAGLVMGAALMAIGVWLHLTERHEHEHRHEALDHEHAHVHDEHHQHAHGPSDPSGEPHTHRHRHEPMVHSHPHYPDLHHRHSH